MSNNRIFSRPLLDLTKVRAESVYRGIRVILTWYWADRKSDYEPCIVLWDNNRPLYRGVAEPIIIPEHMAWRWALHDGTGDPFHCQKSADEWMDAGLLPGTPGDRADRLRILNAIDSRLRDLVLMPPRPAGDLITIGTATLVDSASGDVLHEQDVTQDV